MLMARRWYEYNHANPVEVGTAYPVVPGSPAANATTWGCVGSSCPSVAGSFDLTRFNLSYWRNYERLVAEMRGIGVVARGSCPWPLAVVRSVPPCRPPALRLSPHGVERRTR